MTTPAPTYDLVLLLDPQAETGTRAKIVADTLATVGTQGELLRHDEWGERPMAYPIERRTSAEYHLLQFHAGGVELLSSLEHSLRITDGVLRFRIIKLAPGVPDAPEMPSASAPPRQEQEVETAPGTEAAPAAEVAPASDAPAVEADVAVAEPA